MNRRTMPGASRQPQSRPTGPDRVIASLRLQGIAATSPVSVSPADRIIASQPKLDRVLSAILYATYFYRRRHEECPTNVLGSLFPDDPVARLAYRLQSKRSQDHSAPKASLTFATA